MKSSFLSLALILGLMLSFSSNGQNPDTIHFNYVSEHEYTWTYSCYEALFDAQERPYLYTANNELGFIVYDISNINNPTPVDTFLPAVFDGLKVSNISQNGDCIYASLGGFQGIAQRAGMAIFDISDPANVSVSDTWDSTVFNQGAAIAIADGDYAFLGGMEKGVIVLDVSDKNDIKYVSDYAPDPNWPHIPGIFSTPNARGMTIKGDYLYLCYDAGALRVIDISDKQNLNEVGRYINWMLDSVAQPAYNNVVLVDDYAYIAVDYCGVDIVDISNPANPQNVGWLDPWDCENTPWDGAPGHTNQLRTHRNNSILFVSGADTEIIAYDITDRVNPVQIGTYHAILDSNVTWSIDVNDSYAVLAQVDNPIGVPYDSDWGGIRILQWNGGPTSIVDNASKQESAVYPNPASETVFIDSKNEHGKQRELLVVDITGRSISSQVSNDGIFELNVSKLVPGIYIYHISGSAENREFGRFVVR